MTLQEAKHTLHSTNILYYNHGSYYKKLNKSLIIITINISTKYKAGHKYSQGNKNTVDSP